MQKSMQNIPLTDAALREWAEILIDFHVNSGFSPFPHLVSAALWYFA